MDANEKKELDDLKKFHAEIAQVTGIEYVADGHDTVPGPFSVILDTVREWRAASNLLIEARARIMDLEEDLDEANRLLAEKNQEP